MDDLTALSVFETVRPKSGAKFAAVMTLLECGVPAEGIQRLVDHAPWPDENKNKWHAQVGKISKRFGGDGGYSEWLKTADPYDLVDCHKTPSFLVFAVEVGKVRSGVRRPG